MNGQDGLKTADTLRLEGIFNAVGRTQDGEALLTFAKSAEIGVRFDSNLSTDIPALTEIAGARIPRGMDNGVTVFLNPVKSDEVLAEVLEQQLKQRRLVTTSYQNLGNKP